MDKKTYKILNFLSNHIYGSVVDIRHVVNKIFPYRKGMSKEEFDAKKRLIIRFFEGMEKPIYMVNFNGSRSISEYYENKSIWFEEGKLNNVLITLDGLQSVNQEKFNQSIKSNSKRQTIILLGTLAISLFSLAVSWLNYCATNDKSAQKQYLLPSKELIEQLKPKTIPPITQNPHPTTQNQQKNH